MPLKDLDTLRRSDLVKRIVSVGFDGVGDSYRLKIRVELKNAWLMDLWEHKTPELRRYSYHVFHGEKMIVRWDNAPHFKNIATFPHHKHEGNKIKESSDMTVNLVLRELRKIVKITTQF